MFNFAASNMEKELNMEKVQKVKLIDGAFTPMEAKELLLNLIGSKIQFHTNKNFSAEIRTGETDRSSLEKIISLQGTRQRINDLLGEAQGKDLIIEIQSSIIISIVEKKQRE